MHYFLTSARLGFRCWHETDLPLATELWEDPAVSAFIGGPGTEEMVRAPGKGESQIQECGLQYWSIFLLASGQHAGRAGLRPYDLKPHVYEFGVHRSSAFWKQGLAKEAAHACIVCRMMFRKGVGTQRAKGVFEHSRQLLLKLGFCVLKEL